MTANVKTDRATANPEDRTWGIGIAVFYSVFVLVTLGLVFFASLQRFDLVADSYYEDGVKYQEKIDQKKRAGTAEYKLDIAYNKSTGSVELKFPASIPADSISGNVVLFRPSNAALDRRWTLDIDEDSRQLLDLEGARQGVWKVMVYWKASGADVFTEKSIIVE